MEDPKDYGSIIGIDEDQYLIPFIKVDQLRILKLTKILINESNYGVCMRGLCYHISVAINTLFPSIADNYNYDTLYLLIPLFAKKECERLSSIYRFESPKAGGYWWEKGDIKVRIKYINAMINEIEVDQTHI